MHTMHATNLLLISFASVARTPTPTSPPLYHLNTYNTSVSKPPMHAMHATNLLLISFASVARTPTPTSPPLYHLNHI
ncbi:hypothetical protein PF003_g6680 [Phytophthora fragariae]|nr:hypothetical protein PF003_g6680 [Phytophthora fragariae]